MKRILGLSTLALAGVLAFTGCSCNSNKLTGNAKVVDEAKEYSVEKLAELAKAETGDFTVYSTSSKTEKSVKAFCEKYEIVGTCSYQQVHDTDFYTGIDKLIDGGSKEIDAVVTQDSSQLSERIEDGSLINYNPVVDGAIKDDMYYFMYYIKEFAISKTQHEGLTIDNVWDLAENKDTRAFEVHYKKSGEAINQLFMAELTTDAWAKKLATAYDAKYGAGECAKAVTAGKYANAGYMFVDKFLSNVSVDAGSEGTLAKDTANATKKMVGFSPVSKYSISDKTKDGVTTPATYPKVDFLTEMNGFGGYAYKFYTQVAKTTDRPYTAMLFINYLSTAEGVAHYQEGHGVYSSNTKVSPANNDPSLASVLEKCVVENYGDVKAKWAELKRLIESYQAQ